jgi:hypothetical protein
MALTINFFYLNFNPDNFLKLQSERMNHEGAFF